jgi:hypothetical protein
MSDEPTDYDLARPFVAHVSIYRQKSTPEQPNGGPVLATCTTSLKLDDDEGLRDLTSAIAKSKDGVSANFAGMNNDANAIPKVGDPVFSPRVTAIHSPIPIQLHPISIRVPQVQSLAHPVVRRPIKLLVIDQERNIESK